MTVEKPDGQPVGLAEAQGGPRSRSVRRSLLVAILLVLSIDVAAAVLIPPPGFPNPKPGITANLHVIPPHVLVDLAPSSQPGPSGGLIMTLHPSITSTMLTSWLVIAVLLALAFVATRRLTERPGRLQNFVEYAYDGLEGFAMALGGAPARRYVPLFVGLFLFIIASNWSGLLPVVGRVDMLRAPTSDVNVTVGLALVAFATFHIEGVRRLGLAGYLGKFFNFRGFRRSAFDGVIDLFVGVLEFFLEFFKPVTLSLRLFANIYGGELVLGVMTALLIAVLPLPFLGLELFVGFMQALVFATLTLMFTMLAIESHDEEGHAAHEGAAATDQPLAVHGT